MSRVYCRHCGHAVEETAATCPQCETAQPEAIRQQAPAGQPSPRLSPFGCFLEGFRCYFVMAGRASRRAFWFFTLVSVLISIGLGLIDHALGTVTVSGDGLLQLLFGIAVLIPSITFGVRRLHDRGHSGWWYLLILVPLIGALILIVLWALPGEAATNRFGPPPAKR